MLKKGLVGVLVVLVAVFSLAWFVDFDATELGGAALRQASASTGVRLEASRQRIHLFRGLELDNVEASARFPGGRYEITMPTMRFQHRLTSLVSATLELERVVMVQPRVAIVTGLGLAPTTSPSPSAPRRRRRERPEAPANDPAGSSVDLRLQELELVEAAIAYNDDVSLRGVDLVLKSPTLSPGALTLVHALAATGELSIEELSLRTTIIRNIAATLAASRGRFELVDGSFETERAAFQATSVHLDFNSLPVRYRLSLAGRHADLPGEVSFEGEGFGLEASNLRGEGLWSAAAGVFDGAELWQTAQLEGLNHDAIELPFTVAGGQIVVDGEWIRGTMRFDGELDLIVNGVTIGGTLESPVVR